MSVSKVFLPPFPVSGEFEQYVNDDIENILKRIYHSSQKIKYQNYTPDNPGTLKKTSLVWSGTFVMKIWYIFMHYFFKKGLYSCLCFYPSVEEGLLVRSQNKVSAIAKRFLKLIGLEHYGGVCHGEVSLFNYLFFATKGFFNCEEAQLIRIAKNFFNGASIAPSIMQIKSLSLVEIAPRSDLSYVIDVHEGNKEQNLLETIKILPNGAYSVVLRDEFLKGHIISF